MKKILIMMLTMVVMLTLATNLLATTYFCPKETAKMLHLKANYSLDTESTFNSFSNIDDRIAEFLTLSNADKLTAWQNHLTAVANTYPSGSMERIAIINVSNQLSEQFFASGDITEYGDLSDQLDIAHSILTMPESAQAFELLGSPTTVVGTDNFEFDPLSNWDSCPWYFPNCHRRIGMQWPSRPDCNCNWATIGCSVCNDNSAYACVQVVGCGPFWAGMCTGTCAAHWSW